MGVDVMVGMAVAGMEVPEIGVMIMGIPVGTDGGAVGKTGANCA